MLMALVGLTACDKENEDNSVNNPETKETYDVNRVVEADKVKSGNHTLHRMWVSIYTALLGYAKDGEIKALTNGRWIEGIGSLYGLDSPFKYDDNYYTFHSCWIGEDEFGNKGLFG